MMYELTMNCKTLETCLLYQLGCSLDASLAIYVSTAPVALWKKLVLYVNAIQDGLDPCVTKKLETCVRTTSKFKTKLFYFAFGPDRLLKNNQAHN